MFITLCQLVLPFTKHYPNVFEGVSFVSKITTNMVGFVLRYQ